MMLVLASVVDTAAEAVGALAPPGASSTSRQIDVLFAAMVLVSLMFIAGLFGMMALFLIRYRAGSRADRRDPIRKTWKWEAGWISAATLVGIGLFIAASIFYYRANSPPSDAVTYHVVGKQWMWEIRHPDGRREINALHVPVGQTIKLVLTSEDVIHSFYIPAFRAKQDAVPGRYTQLWFRPTRPGEYHLFCAEFCGAQHSRMTGLIHVMEPATFTAWRQRHPKPPTAQPLGRTGELAFRTLGCDQCHIPSTDTIAPYLEGLFGSTVTLRDGSTITADEQYIRESILNPAEQVVRGYQPIMPTYAGMLNERQIAELVEAVRGLAEVEPPDSTPTPQTPEAADE